jgi:hypothetical protein
MLKPYFISLLLFVAVITANAQVHKLFLDTNRNVTLDSTKAKFYSFTEFLPADSAWAGSIYNLRGDVLSIGTYKDDKLKIPQGKITYYDYNLKFNTDSSQFTMNQYIRTKGFYLNGIKSGIWIDYYFDGYKAYANVYENNKLNGLHEKYGKSGSVLERGNYVNDLKEGNWDFFNGDSVLLSTDVYKDNVIVKHLNKHRTASDRFFNSAFTIYAVNSAHPDFNFNAFLTRTVSSDIPNGVDGVVVVKLFIDKKGVISKPFITRSLNSVVDQAVINALLKSPNWVPANRNHKNLVQEIYCPITFVNSRVTGGFYQKFESYDPYY